MRTAILALVGTGAALLGCNLSSTIGSNETGGSGGSGTSTTSDGNPSVTSTSSTASTSAQTTGSQSTGSQSTTSSTVSTGSGGGQIQNAHVYVHMATDQDWLQDMTLIEIRASATAVTTEFPSLTPAACNATQVPNGTQPQNNWLDLSGAPVTVTADGFGSVQGTWSQNDGTIYAQFNEALPAATPIHLAFDASSSLFPGETLSYATQNFALTAPQLQQVMTYPAGTDWAFDWSAASPMPYGFYAFVTVPNPTPPFPTEKWVATCFGDNTATGVTVPATTMGPIVNDLAAEPQGSQIWFTLNFIDNGPQEQAHSGNFLSSGASVNLSRPVVVSH